MKKRVLAAIITTMALGGLSFMYAPGAPGETSETTIQAGCNPNYSGCVPNDPVDQPQLLGLRAQRPCRR
jgi:hypothetical protein